MDLPRGTYLGDRVAAPTVPLGIDQLLKGKNPLGIQAVELTGRDILMILSSDATSRASNLDHPRVLMRISYSRKLPPFHDMMLSLIDCLRLLPPTSETPLPGTSRRQVAPSLLGFLCHVTGAFTKVYTKIWGPSTFNPVDVRNSAAGKLWIPSAPKKAPIN